MRFGPPKHVRIWEPYGEARGSKKQWIQRGSGVLASERGPISGTFLGPRISVLFNPEEPLKAKLTLCLRFVVEVHVKRTLNFNSESNVKFSAGNPGFRESPKFILPLEAPQD
jgi:hypothetical protein